MAITWRQLAAPQLQTNFQDNSLKGFSDLFSGLVQQNQFAKEKEKRDITETLKSSFFNYSGKEGEEALGTLVSSGQFGKMMTGLGDKVDQDAVRQALLGAQTRLTQNNERDRLQTERDRLLAQKPYVDATDLLISQGKLDEAQAYATGLNQQGVLDNDLSSKVFGALRDANQGILQGKTAQLNYDNAVAKQQAEQAKAQEAAQGEALIRSILTGENVPMPAQPTTTPPKSGAQIVDAGLDKGKSFGVAPSVVPGAPPVPAKSTTTFTASSTGNIKKKAEEPLVIPPEVAASAQPPKVIAEQTKVTFTGVENVYTITTASVMNVVDGDTVDFKAGVKGENRSKRPQNGSDLTCRIDAINAPEMGKDGAPAAPGADRAKQKLTDLLKNGELKVSITQMGKKDAYGRTLCQIEVAGNDIGLEMVKSGAVDLFDKYVAPEIYKEANAQARGGRVGIFAPSPQQQREDAIDGRLKAALADPYTPKSVRDTLLKTAQEREKAKQERNQQAITMRANALTIEEENGKNALARNGLSGQPVGNNLNALEDVLKPMGISGTANPDNKWFMFGANKRDQYEEIMKAFLSDERFKQVDANLAKRFMQQALVNKSNRGLVDDDYGYAGEFKRLMSEYVDSADFNKHRTLVQTVNKTTDQLRKELTEARQQDLRFSPK